MFVIYRIRILIFVSRVEEYVFAFAAFAVLVSNPFAVACEQALLGVGGRREK